jgi:2-keto-4-pentenoate hydratase/2-oxohepta-3-ene-1,7-dioic acid hydratase in catechol pathway
MRLAIGIIDGKRRLLVVDSHDCADVSGGGDDWLAIMTGGSAGRTRVQRASASAPRIPINVVRWSPPIPHPPKIFAVGRNFRDHALEQGAAVPTEPLIFSKLPSALVGHEEAVCLPRQSDQVDYEAELVVVIGIGGRDIPQAEALHHVAGYMCGNDITARDWQKNKPGGQWLLGKSFDTFAPTGPYLVTADEIPDPQNLDICLRLNGQTMQVGNTRHQVFPIRQLIAYLSAVVTLEPGDLIFTGTPSGVGVARTPPVFLQDGDLLEVEIQRIGCLRNRVVAAP